MLSPGSEIRLRLIIRGVDTEWRGGKIVSLKKPSTPDGTLVMSIELPSGKVVKFTDDAPRYEGPSVWRKANTQQLYYVKER